VQNCAADLYSACSAAEVISVTTRLAPPAVLHLNVTPAVTSAGVAWTALRGQFFNVTLGMTGRAGCASNDVENVQHFRNLSTAALQLPLLQAYTEYEVCVYAYNEGGENQKCEVFETLPDKAPGPVEKLTSSATSTSISLRWRKPCPPMAAIRGYRVKVDTVTPYVQASECSDSAAHFCHTIKELQPERTYNIEVQNCATDDGRACSAPEAINVTTGLAAPAVPHLTVAPATTSASVIWTAQRGQFFNMTLEMTGRAGCSSNDVENVQRFQSSTAALQLTQLQAYTEYEVCVYAYNEGGANKKCEVFETLQDEAPGPVEELTSSTKSTSISLRWRKPCPPMAAIRGYRVKVATVTHYVQASKCSDSAAHFCHTIPGLQPERTYNIE
ncbi:neural cell adhesion molecule L1.1-like, partial [Hyalella azteca]|uniref:Neural cell adhesion molecule L1.1-like n=1 Tax=Hyalella azteca TaxID=294128 RepID=A0A8B7P0N8_HYAAZ